MPTAAAGLNDWSDTNGPETRVGLVHATVNTTALSLYLASVVARPGRRRGGKALGLAGLGVLLGGADLGGHLCFVMGVDVNRTAWEQRPDQWTQVLADTELADGEHRKANAGGVPVLLYRTAGTVYALASTCTHMGGPLEEGTISDGCVTCPWPGSTFRFADGSIVRGPATTPEPLATPRDRLSGPSRLIRQRSFGPTATDIRSTESPQVAEAPRQADAVFAGAVTWWRLPSGAGVVSGRTWRWRPG